jgi:hypothetical protein
LSFDVININCVQVIKISTKSIAFCGKASSKFCVNCEVSEFLFISLANLCDFFYHFAEIQLNFFEDNEHDENNRLERGQFRAKTALVGHSSCPVRYDAQRVLVGYDFVAANHQVTLIERFLG